MNIIVKINATSSKRKLSIMKKFLKSLKIKIIKSSIALISSVFALSMASILLTSSANALTVNGGQDCSSNSVINCGVTSTNELSTYLPGHTAILDLYANSFGINSADISNINNTTANANEDYTVAGTVNVNNDVIVNGKIVATNAITAGRENISNSYGSSTKVTYAGYDFYVRTPRVSFTVSSFDAFVVMKNGVFQFAILAPCGNPVKATPVVVTPPPVVTPSMTCDSISLTDNSTTTSPETVTAVVHYTASGGAVFQNVSYTYTDTDTGTSVNLIAGSTNTYQFTSYGLKSITASVNYLANGVLKNAANVLNCSHSITFAAPSNPNYACNTIVVNNNPNLANTVIVSSTFTAANGATFSKLVYDFGDNNTGTVTTPTSTTVTHTYGGPGSYLISATYSFMVNGSLETVSSSNCTFVAVFGAPITPMCTIVGLTQYPASSPNCVVVAPPKATIQPAALVNTGPGTLGDFILFMLVAAGISGTAYYIYNKKRLDDLK
jgi:hypothetical protein